MAEKNVRVRPLRVVGQTPGRTAQRARTPWNNERLRDLVRFGLATEEQIDIALAEKQRTGKSMARLLSEMGVLSEDNIREALARWSGYEFVHLGDSILDPDALRLIPDRVARKHGVLPLGFDGTKLVLAVSDPTDVMVMDDLRILSGREIKVVVAGKSDIAETFSRLAQQDRSAETLLKEAEKKPDPALEARKKAAEIVGDRAQEAPIVKAIDQIITQAVRRRASDIHVQPHEDHVQFRFRVDGVLHDANRAPRNLLEALVSRLKVMSGLDIAEKRLPQDGRMTVSVDGGEIDLRVATFPSVTGEEVVMRILDRKSSQLSLTDLGLLEGPRKRLESSLDKPYGTILVTGPTGSGKSTTMYASLHILNTPDRNIITVEDPVEARIAGLRQMQVNNRAGLTFASALRAIVRADPDIIMIGEIRDLETASIAVQAALTGHLVLATLHTNDSPSAVTRLVEMGIEPFLVASALDCVVGQRLARRLCKCKEAYTPTPLELTETAYPWKDGEDIPTLYRPKGCAVCGRTGYRGRIVITEVMLVSPEIEALTLSRRSSDELKAIALEQGMITMRNDGMLKVGTGITSLQEVLRVVV